jgi:hypothetical protein
MDVVGPAACEDVTDFLAGYQGRCLPTDLSRSQPDRSSFGHVGFNLDMRQVRLERRMRVLNPWDVADPPFDVLGVLLQLRKVGPVNAHHDGLAAAGQHFLDALPKIGLHVAIEPRIGLDDTVHFVQGLVVIDRRTDTDPVLTEVHTVDLVSQIRLPDMGAAIAHPLNLFEVFAGQH